MAYIPSLICIKMSCLQSFASKGFQIGQSAQVSLFSLNSSACLQRTSLFILSLEGTKFPHDKTMYKINDAKFPCRLFGRKIHQSCVVIFIVDIFVDKDS